MSKLDATSNHRWQFDDLEKSGRCGITMRFIRAFRSFEHGGSTLFFACIVATSSGFISIRLAPLSVSSPVTPSNRISNVTDAYASEF